MNKDQLKELVKNIMTEESEYQAFFKKALEKAGKSIPSMSDEEKKAFFDKIDSAWDGKGEKNEGNAFGAAVTAAKKAGDDEFKVGGETYKVEEKLVGGQHKLDVDGDGDIEGDDLADLRAGKKADEGMELPKATIPSAVKSKLDMAIDKIKDSDLTYNQKIQVVGQVMDSLGIDKAEFNKMASKLKGTIESVNEGSHGMATKLLQSIVSGDSSRAEGTKMSKELAQHYIDWIRTSPFGKKNGNLPLDMLVKASFNWGIERGLDSKLKGELSKLKSTIKESLSPEVAKHMGSIHKGFKKVEDDGVMVYDSPTNAKKAADFLNSKKIAASFDGKYVYLESVNEAVDVKAGGYRLVSKPNEGIKLYYGGKVIATGFYDMDDWYFWMKHSSWGGDMGFNNPKEIINYFRAKKITTESVNEGVSSTDMDKIKGAVEAANSFMSVGAELKKLGMKYTFATEPLPIYIIQPTPNNKVAIVNKKYATKPDFVVGDIAVGIMESKSSKSVNEGRAFINAARKAKTEGLTEFEFNGKKYPVTIKD
jgi:hypothetical protein